MNTKIQHSDTSSFQYFYYWLVHFQGLRTSYAMIPAGFEEFN